jgi:hypothetical protein
MNKVTFLGLIVFVQASMTVLAQGTYQDYNKALLQQYISKEELKYYYFYSLPVSALGSGTIFSYDSKRPLGSRDVIYEPSDLFSEDVVGKVIGGGEGSSIGAINKGDLAKKSKAAASGLLPRLLAAIGFNRTYEKSEVVDANTTVRLYRKTVCKTGRFEEEIAKSTKASAARDILGRAPFTLVTGDVIFEGYEVTLTVKATSNLDQGLQANLGGNETSTDKARLGVTVAQTSKNNSQATYVFKFGHPVVVAVLSRDYIDAKAARRMAGSSQAVALEIPAVPESRKGWIRLRASKPPSSIARRLERLTLPRPKSK